MNLAQKIGQLLVVGFSGTELNEHIRRMITEYHVGNIILFESNCKSAEQVFHLVQDLQKLAMESNGIPLFITIDQENGIVTRIYDGVTVFPGNMAQSAGATIEETKQIGRCTGIGLRALGVNFNLAPSVDINNNPHNPVIGTRSFGETTDQVAKRAVAYIEGLQETGVIATAKHFPGHGDTNVDSHLSLPIITHEKERLAVVELYPFKAVIEAGVKAIMSAHIQFPAYEPTCLPATLSYRVLTGLLREELGFKGIIMTDCMEMKAIDTYYGTAKATPMAIQAGADLVCLSHSEEKQLGAIQEIYEAIKSGNLSEQRINQSIERIMTLKKIYDIEKFLKTTYSEAEQELYQKSFEMLAQRVSDTSITIVKNNGLLPIKANSILVVAPNGRVLTGADGTRIAPNFAKVFKEKVINRQVEAYEIENEPEDEQIEELIDKAKHKELIIMCTYNGILVPKQIELAHKLIESNPNVILIPMRNPYDIEAIPHVGCCLLPYDYTIRAMDSLIKVLLGEIEAVGKIPVTLKRSC